MFELGEEREIRIVISEGSRKDLYKRPVIPYLGLLPLYFRECRLCWTCTCQSRMQYKSVID